MASIDDATGGEPITGKLHDNPVGEAQHFYKCPRCGQQVDARDFAAVFHHELANHQPLPEAEATRLETASEMLRKIDAARR